MHKMNKLLKLSEKKVLIVIFILLSVMIVSNALIELNQNRKDLFAIMEKQSHSLLESIMTASKNTTQAISFIDYLETERIIDNANLINHLITQSNVTNQELESIRSANSLDKIIIFNPQNVLSHYAGMDSVLLTHTLDDLTLDLENLFDNEVDTINFGTFRDVYSDRILFGLAFRTGDKHIIYLETDVSEQISFKLKAGFGTLINTIAQENEQIVYIAFQDSSGILAATGNVNEMQSITQDEFLNTSFRDSTSAGHKVDFQNQEIFEMVHPFVLNGTVKGLLRIGLSTTSLQEINSRVFRRLIIVAFVLLLLALLISIYLFQRKEFSSLKQNYQLIESYSSLIINNVSDVIIVYDDAGKISKINKAATSLFHTEPNLDMSIQDFLANHSCLAILDSISDNLVQIDCSINSTKKTLLVSKSSFTTDQGISSNILVIKDLTEISKLREKSERSDRLTAMGELAAGVAHEIRNPLNSISTIAQQLGKDFEPNESAEEYHELVQIIYSEVNRINSTVKDFLRFARPEAIHPEAIEIEKFFSGLQRQYHSSLEELNIRFRVQLAWTGIVYWDANQMKQVFINLIQNAVDAIKSEGLIQLVLTKKEEGSLEIVFKDDGPGFDEKSKNQLFNLYYTTKPQGTGIGLSLVQRIIFEHGGYIAINPDYKEGACFAILMPISSPEAMR